MGGLSLWHLLILMTIVLVMFGPNRLPGLGRTMGEALRAFKKGLEHADLASRPEPPTKPRPEREADKSHG